MLCSARVSPNLVEGVKTPQKSESEEPAGQNLENTNDQRWCLCGLVLLDCHTDDDGCEGTKQQEQDEDQDFLARIDFHFVNNLVLFAHSVMTFFLKL